MNASVLMELFIIRKYFKEFKRIWKERNNLLIGGLVTWVIMLVGLSGSNDQKTQHAFELSKLCFIDGVFLNVITDKRKF